MHDLWNAFLCRSECSPPSNALQMRRCNQSEIECSNNGKSIVTYQLRPKLSMLNPVWLFWWLNLDYCYQMPEPSLLLDSVIRHYLSVEKKISNEEIWGE